MCTRPWSVTLILVGRKSRSGLMTSSSGLVPVVKLVSVRLPRARGRLAPLKQLLVASISIWPTLVLVVSRWVPSIPLGLLLFVSSSIPLARRGGSGKKLEAPFVAIQVTSRVR